MISIALASLGLGLHHPPHLSAHEVLCEVSHLVEVLKWCEVLLLKCWMNPVLAYRAGSVQIVPCKESMRRCCRGRQDLKDAVNWCLQRFLLCLCGDTHTGYPASDMQARVTKQPFCEHAVLTTLCHLVLIVNV